MEDKIKRTQLVVLGRVVDPSGRPPRSLFLIDGGRDGRRIACDALGHFKIDLTARRKFKLGIERDGAVVSQTERDPAGRVRRMCLELLCFIVRHLLKEEINANTCMAQRR